MAKHLTQKDSGKLLAKLQVPKEATNTELNNLANEEVQLRMKSEPYCWYKLHEFAKNGLTQYVLEHQDELYTKSPVDVWGLSVTLEFSDEKHNNLVITLN